jgi:hypothetical protein
MLLFLALSVDGQAMPGLGLQPRLELGLELELVPKLKGRGELDGAGL